MELPLTKQPVITQDPKNLIIYGVPKVGKTTLLSTLPSCLIVDLEQGSDYVEAYKVKINTLPEFIDLCKSLRQYETDNDGKHAYKFIAIDTVTALEEFAKPLALNLFKKTPMGAKSDCEDILTLPMGAGYGYLRTAIEKLIDMISIYADNIIIIGHVKDESITDSEGKEVGSVKDFDLTGKVLPFKRVIF